MLSFTMIRVTPCSQAPPQPRVASSNFEIMRKPLERESFHETAKPTVSEPSREASKEPSREQTKESPREQLPPSDMSKSFASLFVDEKTRLEARRQEEHLDIASTQSPPEIPRNREPSVKKMLYDPKRGIMVEPTALELKGRAEKPEKKIASRAEKVKEENWKRNAEVAAPAESVENNNVPKRAKKRGNAEHKEKEPKKEPKEAKADAMALQLKTRRDAERSSRPPRTKGVLYEFTEGGELRQLLSPTEMEEIEKQRQKELAEELERERERQRASHAEVKAPVAPKPAWQAPLQTLVDIGVVPPSMNEVFANAAKKSKKEKFPEKKKARKESKRTKEKDLPGNHSSPFKLDDDTTNLDIRNQEAPPRDPSTYPTFIPGTGLSPSVEPWTPSLNYTGLDLDVPYNMVDFGINHSINDNGW